MNRFMSRLITKAKIPVWYTEGFHQHLYMNFAVPLSLGYEGLYEIMDIRLIDDNYSLDECLSALRNACPEDIEFFDIKEDGMHMKTIGFAEFNIEFENYNDEISMVLENFLKSESIICQKTGKKGKIKEIDLIPKIKSFKMLSKGLNITLVAGSEDNLNPSLVMNTFFEKSGIAPVFYNVSRIMIYNKNGEEFK